MAAGVDVLERFGFRVRTCEGDLAGDSNVGNRSGLYNIWVPAPAERIMFRYLTVNELVACR